MTSTTASLTTAVPAQRKGLNRASAALLFLETLLMIAPIVILGSAINWPASLDEPASVVLPLIAAQSSAVRLGYFLYLLYSVLFWPVALLVVRSVAGRGAPGLLLQLAAGFGVASAVLRTLGIIRWLFPMPLLAQTYVATRSEQTRATIDLIYATLNAYAGSIGEVLGVSLFAGLWMLMVSVAIMRSTHLPRWLGGFGLLVSLGLFSLMLEIIGLDLGPYISVSVSLLHIWFLALAGVLLLRRTAV